MVVVPENIHTPTTEGIHASPPPPSSPDFPFFEHKSNPPPLWNCHKVYVYPHTLWKKTVLARKCVKVKVNTQPSSLHVTVVYSRWMVTSEDTNKENVFQIQ